MPLPSQENNVAPLPGRSRYSVVNTTATWCYHHMAPGVSLNGAAPKTATKDPNELDPAIKASTAEYRDLTEGGLFTIQAKAKRTLVVDAIDNPAGATLTIKGVDHNHERNAPSSVPFKLASGEVLKATGGTAGSYIGILYRIDGEEIW